MAVCTCNDGLWVLANRIFPGSYCWSTYYRASRALATSSSVTGRFAPVRTGAWAAAGAAPGNILGRVGGQGDAGTLQDLPQLKY